MNFGVIRCIPNLTANAVGTVRFRVNPGSVKFRWPTSVPRYVFRARRQQLLIGKESKFGQYNQYSHIIHIGLHEISDPRDSHRMWVGVVKKLLRRVEK